MQELVKMGVMDQDELNDMEDKGHKGEVQGPPKSFFGFDYNYNTDTDDEDKYLSKDNRNFYKMNRSKKHKHLKSLWRKIYNQAVGCSIIIN